MNKALSLLVTIFIFASTVNALDLNINNRKPQCFYLEVKRGDSRQISYEVTGYKPEQFKMSVYDSDTLKTEPIHVIQQQRQGIYALTGGNSDTEYKICFESLDSSGKILQFEFQKLHNNSDVYANDKSLQKTFNEATEAYRLMNDIYTNLRHSLMKTEMQTKILESTENKVKWCSVVKMILMIAITTIQIIFLTGLFKDYNPIGI